MNLMRAAILVLVLVGVAWLWQTGPHQSPDVWNPSPPQTPIPMAADSYHGLALQIHDTYQLLDRYLPAIREIADTGADTIMVCNAAYMADYYSNQVYMDVRTSPSADEWRRLLQECHRQGLKVILMPFILATDPGDDWRGSMKPADWDKWFTSYTNLMLYYAQLAQENQVEVLVVGSELVSSERIFDKWMTLIDRVRQMYKGKLCYSANWDHYESIKFWDRLDLVGMTSYHTLASKKAPTVEELMDAWAPIKDRILKWQQRIGRPIVFTEVGWCSQEGAASEPWNYYHEQRATSAGLEEQRRCYEAFMRTWDDTPGVAGVIWWEWAIEGGGTGDFNYIPKGKPAEQELRAWFARQRGGSDALMSRTLTIPPPLGGSPFEMPTDGFRTPPDEAESRSSSP
jgi:hypothetical protein